MAGDEVGRSIVVPTIYGQIICNRHDINQTNSLIKTGKAVDHELIYMLAVILGRRKDPVFIDVGGCFGTYTIALAPVCEAVHVFEPQRLHCQMIAGSAALNSLSNVYMHCECLGEKRDFIASPTFDYDKPLNFGSVEFGPIQVEKIEQERGEFSGEFVDISPLDECGFSKLDVLKVDAEGMEDAVLRGAARTIERCRPVILVEMVKAKGTFQAKEYSFWNIPCYGQMLCIPNEFREQVKDITDQIEHFNKEAACQNNETTASS